MRAEDILRIPSAFGRDLLWALLGSNQRPYACEAYALNQLS